MSPIVEHSSASRPACLDRTRILESTIELRQLGPYWESLNTQPNAEPGFFQLINESRGPSVRPFVMTVEGVDGPAGLAVGRIEQVSLTCRVGYKTVRLADANQLSIIHGGLLGHAAESGAELVFTALRRCLRQGKFDLVFLNNLDTRCRLFSLATRSPGWLCKDHLVAPQLHWKASLPENQAEFLKRLNKKHRYWVRRLEKLVEADFPGQVSFVNLSRPADLARALNDVEQVAAKTYQRQLGSGFRNDLEGARRMEFESRNGWLRAYVLYLRGQPAAFWIGRLYKNVFFSDSTGYDPAFRDYELGTIVFIRMIDELCREGVRSLDFGLGDAMYKQRFGDESWSEAAVRIFAPRLRMAALNAAQTCIELPVLAARSLLRRTDLQQRLKTLWRKRLIQTNGQPSSQ